MLKTIKGAADCEIRSVIRFLNARNVLPSEIHHQICQMYGDNAMSDGMVMKWVRMFNEGREVNTCKQWAGTRLMAYVARQVTTTLKIKCLIHLYHVKWLSLT